MPEPKRLHGYYVLPFLLGDALVARVDLKADRTRAALIAQAAHGEPGTDTEQHAGELAEELRTVANWLELDRVEVRRRGDLAAALQRASR